MADTKASRWQLHRSSLNHRWLKNTYLMSFAKWGSVVDGKVNDPGFLEETFISNMLADWREHGSEARILVEGYEFDMSPSGLFDVHPLSRCDMHTQEWLRAAIHELWKVRHCVKERTHEVLDMIKKAGNAYQAIIREFEEGSECSEAVREIGDCCYQLSQALSRLESKVSVI
jgi:hypothetical protein